MNGSTFMKCIEEGQRLVSKRANEPQFLLAIADERIVSIFEVDLSGPKDSYGELFCTFGSITEKGSISLWNYITKQRYWEAKTGLEQVSGGCIILAEDGQQATAILQSRDSGINIYKFTDGIKEGTISEGVKLQFPKHVGFCNILVHSNLLLFPMHQTSFGVLPLATLDQFSKNEISTTLDQPTQIGACSSIMFIKVFKSACGDDFIIYGTEDGSVRVASLYHSSLDGDMIDAIKIARWDSTVQLNDPQCTGAIPKNNRNVTEDELITPVCGEFRKQNGLVIVGTNTKSLFILNLDYDKMKIGFEGKKSLINKGVNCMELHKDGKLLATGGWDGVIRIFSFPFMNQIVSINFHKSSIQTLHFVNKSEIESIKQYNLLCGAEDGQISCWKIHS